MSLVSALMGNIAYFLLFLKMKENLNMTLKEKFEKLIHLDENTGLDFKEKYHDNKADLIHDILCMANADTPEDRYILFGVKDKTKKPKGLDAKTKHTQNDLIQLIRDASPNRSFYNSLSLENFEIEEKKFALLTIQNRPDKPFFLNKDYCEQNEESVRAGAVYTRNKDGNTPKNKSALDDEIELMYRRRFGIDLSVSEKFDLYLSNEEWVKSSDTDGYFCKKFPEFRIKCSEFSEQKGKTAVNDIWMPYHWWIMDIYRSTYRLYYFDMCMSEKDIWIWWCDNGRIPVPLPEHKPRDKNLEEKSWDLLKGKQLEYEDRKAMAKELGYGWQLSKQSLTYKVAKVIAKSHGLDLDEEIKVTEITILD